ncbi:MAG: cyanophycin synthetase [Candidatus Peribacteraceae bacterium]|nr:cyanophycin synthetase [Candidatus Peribacteraceae bacterium]MDD5740204.1 cyanophycin synthetase [Candidatus Peribacteraceae bacterium]
MKIYCSGIGGIGLSAYASYRASQGHHVLGSDRAETDIVRDLQGQGIEVFLKQDGSHIPEDVDLFVYSEAIPETSPERVRAAELSIPQQSYFQALGELTRLRSSGATDGQARDFRVIAVCGTHGKSSTTAMTARVLIDAGLDPSVIVGTKMREMNGRNWRKGGSQLFVVEACEYRRSFHFLSPEVILLTNADGDHFDYYRSQEDYEQAFVDFVKRLPPDGLVITHGKDPVCASIAERGGRTVIDADAFPLPALATPGVHMQQNAQLVLALAEEFNVDQAQTLISLSGYAGSWRRMEVKGETTSGVTVIDDYGHHPVEIRATVQAILGAYPGRRLVVVFQPHTHDRTHKLYEAFTQAFTGSSVVIIPNIYDARPDRESGLVDISAFVRDIGRGSRVQAIDGKSLLETERLLREEILKSQDVLLILGAGNVTKLAGRMVNE